MPVKGVIAAVALLLSTLLLGCSYNPLFAFPVQEGNIDAGRKAFVDHHCQQCHSVAGVKLPPLAGAPPPIFELGGKTSSAKTYAELMTAIINPNHYIADKYRDQLRLQGRLPLNSPMPMPNLDTMTVRQLIDIVAFLDSRYQFVEGYDSEY